MIPSTERDRIIEIFLAETAENLASMERALVAMESATDPNPGPLNEVFRIVHMLKGDAASLGFGPTAQFAHELEGVLDRLRTGALRPSSDVVSGLLAAVDAARELVARADPEGAPLPDRARHLLEAIVRVESMPPSAHAPVVDVDETSESQRRARTLRVPVEKLDRMLDLTGEVDIARGRLSILLADGSATRDALVEAHQEMDRLFSDLQDLVMKARLVPLGPLFRHQFRTVRDVCTLCDKRADLQIEGEDVEVDTALFEHLRDPLTHLIRNAIDHGLETQARRRELGKNPVGRLRLRAAREGSTIVVELSDDGAGLDTRRIAQRAKELGLHPEPERLPSAELHRFVLHPGFSTASQVTTVSGRGVGLDIVQQKMEALRGTLTLASEPGQGLRVVLRFPLTLAIIDGFSVAVGRECFILPLESVLECVELPAGASVSQVLSLRGDVLPYLRLRDVFRVHGEASRRENVVVVQHGGERLGLVVDSLLGQRQAVVKPLGRAVEPLPGIAGSAIQGDGRVALVLDLTELLDHTLARAVPGGSTSVVVPS